MSSWVTGSVRAGAGWMQIQLLAFVLLLGAAFGAQAQSVDCSDYGGVLDGSVAGAPNPSQLNIDVDVCVVRNYPASAYPPPLGFIANLNFEPGPQRLVIFDNVYWSGNIACNAVQGHKIWFVNGSVHTIRPECQNVLIPVESINKTGPAYAAVGIPFTYRLLIPVLIDPQTGAVVANGTSQNDLHGITLYDNLGAAPVTVSVNGPDDNDPSTPPVQLPVTIPGTGVDLSLVGVPSVRWCANLACTSLGASVSPTFSNVNGLLKFDFGDSFILPEGDRIAIDVTVVLNNSSLNALGTIFVNSAVWQFGRRIDGTFYTPLPGANGISGPTTIAGPNLVVEKTGTPALGGTTINLGEWGEFTIDVANSGQFDAWNVTLLDRLPPDAGNGGMCDLTPQITGVQLGGAQLTQGVHYTLTYTGPPTCELSLTLLDAAGPLAPGQHLVLNYRTKLDADSQNGALTNVAGATRWFNDDSGNPARVEVNDPLTNGTVGTADNEDAHTLTVFLSGYFFEKSVRNVTSGANPATTAAPGDTLHYTLRLQATDSGFTDVVFRDQLPPDFVAGSLVFGPLPAGAANNSNPATGLIDIRNLDVPAGGEVRIEFDVTLRATLTNGHIVVNQAELLDSAQVFLADSDDPNVNGQANPDPSVDDEDQTRVRILAPPQPPTKTLVSPSTAEATIGEEIVYRIAVPGAPRNTSMYDVQVTDVLNPNLEYVSATITGGSGVTNTSTGSQMSIAIAEIAAGQQALVELHVRVRNVLTAQQGVNVSNTASFTYSETDGGAAEPALTTNAVTFSIVEPHTTINKAANRTTAVANDIIRYTITLTAASGVDASSVFDVSITDTLSAGLVYAGNPTVTGAGNTIGAPVVTGDGGAGAPQTLVWSLGDGNADIDIVEGESITISYDVRVLDTVLADQNLTNSAVARWTGIDGPNAGERTGADGVGSLNDYVTAPGTTTITTPGARPAKVLISPTTPEATIGQEVVYRITAPSAVSSSVLHDVAITDVLDANLEYVSATVTGVAGFTNTSTPTQLNIAIPQIPAGQQAVIELHARVRNVQTAQQGVQVSNTASYTYATSAGGAAQPPLSSVPATFTIIEPHTTIAKTGDTTAVSGGDVVRYTVTLTAAGGADASDVFDVAIVDTLTAGLVYAGNPTVSGAGNTISAPVITGDGSAGNPQRLVWGLADANADIDIAEGAAITISYDVRVLDGIPALQSLANSVTAQWTGLDGGSIYERTGAGCPAITQPNDYCTGPATHTVLTDPPELTFHKTVLTGATANPGDVVRYRLYLTNRSNITFSGFSLVDNLDQFNDPAMFVPGTLTLVSALPAGATNNSTPTGGSQGTGLIDIGNLSLGAAGSATESVIVEFTVQLAPVIANGTIVLNQARVTYSGTELQRSDDPVVTGDADPTPITIQSAPVFRVQKVSYDVTGDPNLLLAGETLRYTITVKNIGNDNAADATIRDQIPVNTTYVAGSTTLNGAAVADVSGSSPLVNGLSIHAPENATPGAMRADASDTPSNVATITFSVIVNADVVDGTVISNQAYVSAIAGGVVDYPSDDPMTPIANDPTRDVVGSQPLIYADKRAVLLTDNSSPGIVDPGDVLRYTITVYNNGVIPATGAVLRDAVPTNTAYYPDSVTLNGLPVGQPDGGISPLVAGIDISSVNLTPPLPTAGQGVLSPGAAATIQFDVRVNAAVPAGTLITNQAIVRSNEAPNVLTDGDGNPATGPEPTVVVVGNAQQLTITKQVAVVGGGAAVAGATLEYLVRVANISSVPAQYVLITDDLSMPFPGYLTYVDQSATLNGAGAGITVAGTLITADYSTSYGPLQPGQSAVLRFRAVINPTLAIGTTITNTGVVAWDNPPRTASASVSIGVGGIVGVGILSGTVWHDANFNRTAESSERLLDRWSVELYRNDRLVHSASTDTSGAYRISGIAPNYVSGERYELRFAAPGAGSNTAKLGRAHSVFNNDLQRITDIVIQPGSNYQNVNLPIEPNGVVYNTITRGPISGATITMLNAGSQTALPASCFYDPSQQNQVTLPYGYYKFDLNFSDPACPVGGSYVVDVVAPAVGFIAGPSQIIPPTSDVSTGPFPVPVCPASADDAIMTTAQHCEVQISEFAPPVSVRARTAGTRYHKHFTFDDSFTPGTAQIFNNHIPLDPDLQGVLQLSKITPMLNVTRGQLVPYTITFNNVTDIPLFDVAIVDRFPAGFRYVEGSARIDGVPTEPTLVGRELTWRDLSVDANARHSLVLLLAVGAGVSEGEFTNRAQAVHGFTNNALSNEGSATVRVIPDATFDCTDVTGKVFDDANRNGIQDSGELGLSGVRVVSARGLNATTDGFGRFHITCAVVPREGRGSNFILKLDDRTLPSGFRASTDQIRVQRATRGKALRFNFGASIHRVVGLDIADAVFEPGTTEMRAQWKPRMNLLLEELQKGPAVLRLSYLADVEDAQLVEKRMEAVKKEIMQSWKAMNCCYQLTIEPEVFWRRGAPAKQVAVQPTSR
jgi:uncharacterized repeat protein (TIGR01451 family)/fimbrial isopeptide formation D2 family protein